MLYDPTKDLTGWRKLLYEAAELIEKEGWARPFSREGHCIAQAMLLSARSTKDYADAHAAFERAIHEPAAHWNDLRCRTKEEVIAKLREIALGE